VESKFEDGMAADVIAVDDPELLGGIPLAGFFAAGEIGPIAGRNALIPGSGVHVTPR
jgi:small ligand-binding sensory domain FIST